MVFKPLRKKRVYESLDESIAQCKVVDISDDYSRENALFKIDTILDVLTEFRDAVEREGKYQRRIERKRAKVEAENNK